jgi:hypothetical protein
LCVLVLGQQAFLIEVCKKRPRSAKPHALTGVATFEPLKLFHDDSVKPSFSVASQTGDGYIRLHCKERLDGGACQWKTTRSVSADQVERLQQQSCQSLCAGVIYMCTEVE